MNSAISTVLEETAKRTILEENSAPGTRLAPPKLTKMVATKMKTAAAIMLAAREQPDTEEHKANAAAVQEEGEDNPLSH